jgi:hypothetical protein
MVEADATYRCSGCGQLLPFDHECRVPDVCLQRCRGRCDWVRVADPDAAALGDG